MEGEGTRREGQGIKKKKGKDQTRKERDALLCNKKKNGNRGCNDHNRDNRGGEGEWREGREGEGTLTLHTPHTVTTVAQHRKQSLRKSEGVRESLSTSARVALVRPLPLAPSAALSLIALVQAI